ncbi:MAG: hypothetical protein ACU85V_04805 [Gammaproteobacteria bacterium]
MSSPDHCQAAPSTRARWRASIAVFLVVLQALLPVIHAHPGSQAHELTGPHLPHGGAHGLSPRDDCKLLARDHHGVVISVGPALSKRAENTPLATPEPGTGPDAVPVARVAARTWPLQARTRAACRRYRHNPSPRAPPVS